MANDKDFKVKNGVKPTVYHEGLGTVSVAGGVATLDLSTGSVFDYTPTSDVQVTLSNPAASGTVSGATLLLTSADPSGVGDVFSTYLYTGTPTNVSHQIQNGIDLAGEGGLVWIKKRDSLIADTNHHLVDTERGDFYLASNSANAQSAGSDINTFNSDGWTFDASTGLGTDYNGATYVSWTFRKAQRFFDVVTWTGTGMSSIPHNLGVKPACIIFKRSDGNESWIVYHQNLTTPNANWWDNALTLDTTNAGVSVSGGTYLTQEPDENNIYIGSFFNPTNKIYVAYLFAHDPLGPSGDGSDGLIACGSYTGSSNTPQNITLGWEPQWVLLKKSSTADDWRIFDTQRGMSAGAGNNAILEPNTSDAEASSSNWIIPISTGFTAGSSATDTANYIYIAIRAESVPTITYNSALQWTGGTAPTAPAIGETDVITLNTRDGGTTYNAALAIDGAK